MRTSKFGRLLALLLCAALLIGGGTAAAEEEAQPVTAEEIIALAEEAKALALASQPMNDPASEEASSEDGTAFQYDFGTIYADRAEMTEETKVNAVLVMSDEMSSVRGIAVSRTVNELIAAVPCANPEMYGTWESAVLYLTGTEEHYRYGLVRREGQRISAIEYGDADVAAGRRIALTCQIAGDGVNTLRLDGLNEPADAEDLAELYAELSELKNEAEYHRYPVRGGEVEPEAFGEADLDFLFLSYLTAEPARFGENVEDALIDNGDGTFLRRIDGDGFVAVFMCDREGNDAVMVSYEILDPDMEGPRGVRLGDYFQEDYNRFPSGGGAYDEETGRENLYGSPDAAPFGTAEYGPGDEIVLRYVTDTLDGRTVELYLHYRETQLDTILIHTL